VGTAIAGACVLASLVVLGAGCSALPAAGEGRDAVAEADLALRGRQSDLRAGARSFEGDGFGRMDDQLALGVDYLAPIGLANVRLETGLHYSFDETQGETASNTENLETYTLELTAGPNVAWSVGRFRPYLGAGGSLIFVQQRALDAADDVFRDNDITWGGYLGGGLLFQMTRSSHVGLEYRHLFAAEVTLDGQDVDASYDQVVLVLGASF